MTEEYSILESRLAGVIETLRHHEEMSSHFADRLRKIETSIAVSESNRMALREYFDEKFGHMEKTTCARFKRLEDAQNTQNAALRTILWLIIAAIVGGIMQFIIRGGLNIPLTG